MFKAQKERKERRERRKDKPRMKHRKKDWQRDIKIMNEEIEIESDRKLRNRKRIKSKRTFTDEIMESKEKNVLNIRKEKKKKKT